MMRLAGLVSTFLLLAGCSARGGEPGGPDAALLLAAFGVWWSLPASLPTAEAAMRVWMQISACDAMPVVAGVKATHSPLPSSLNLAT